jgi:large subunit ribosomal protein L5
MSDENSENPMREIRIGKVVVNISVGASGDPLDRSMTILKQITGQTPCPRQAKQTIRQWGIRRSEPMACMVTLRGESADSFLRRAFQGIRNRINPRSFDKNGNFAFGIREHIDIPGTRYDPNLGITGMDIMVNVERPGYRVSKRKRVRSKIGSGHRITPKESQRFLQETYGITLGYEE